MKLILQYVLALCAGLLIFLGLPLLGWGIRQIPVFFDQPARLAYVIVIVCLQLFGILYNPQAGRNKEDRKSGVASHKIDLVLIQILSLAIVVVAPFSDGHSIGIMNVGDAFRIAGLIVMIPGFIFMQMAEKHLGKQFSIEVTLQKGHKLIQDGPYTFIRHPRYLGILTFFTGISLAFRSLFSVLLVAALCVVLIWRVQAEESLMSQEFGQEWDVYRKKSWRIIPFVF